jgi:hypothetical protein
MGVARLVEIMLRWPQYLDRFAGRLGDELALSMLAKGTQTTSGRQRRRRQASIRTITPSWSYATAARRETSRRSPPWLAVICEAAAAEISSVISADHSAEDLRIPPQL